MPNYAPLPEQDVTEPLDMSRVPATIGEMFDASRKSAYSHYTKNMAINNLSNIKPVPEVPSSYPITQEEVNAMTADNPELKIPVGVPKFVAGMMKESYDNDKNLALVAQFNPGRMAKIAGFGGSIFGQSADMKMWLYGGGFGSAGKMLGSSLAEKAIASFGSRELFGSAAARTGTFIAEKYAEGAGFVEGAGISDMTDTERANTVIGKPHEYIKDLQEITVGAALEGGPFNVALGLGGRALIGKKMVIGADGSLINREPVGNEPYQRQGGLLNRPEFKDMGSAVKDYIVKIFKPLTKDAEITMKEEATGQMFNGAADVNLDPIVKQGMADAGVEFQQGINQWNQSREKFPERPVIDPEEFDRQLQEAQDNITSEMFLRHQYDNYIKKITDKDFKQYKNTVNDVFERLSIDSNFVDHPFYHGTGDLSDISQFDITRSGLTSLYGEGLYITDNKFVASGYARSRGGVKNKQFAGNILEMNFKENPKLIDVELKPADDVFSIVKDVAEKEADGLKIGDSFKEKPLNDSIELIKDHIYEDTGSVEHIYSVLSTLNNRLEESGYDGYLHTGGLRVGDKKHNVAVLFGHEYSQNGQRFSKNPADKLEQKTIDTASNYDEKLKTYKALSGELDKKIEEVQDEIKKVKNKLDVMVKDPKVTESKINFEKSKITAGEKQIANYERLKKIDAVPERPPTESTLDDLLEQYNVAQALRDHSKGTHELLTEPEVQQYAKDLNTSGVKDNGYTTAYPEGKTTESYLREFSDKQIEELSSKFKGVPEIMEEFNKAREAIANKKVFDDMTQNMTDCILKGSV